ncbi:hypothetical protein EKO27_g11206 [Xylaria grammica]|uniref:Transcription factor domain-containing protein n=1 Tax=Xylaria grammica TaxID=363999 RepID=A0A439CP13_9PEZI|nr:hypothetical protein EKO27_g11206 [Xylaria grammica]
MAIELGMHRKSFADRTLDLVWAESCRRTWWYIKFQGMIRRLNEAEPVTGPYDIDSDADIPFSEEWQYQAGNIQLPVSLAQYEREINLGRSEFPSLAFQIEICRIQADITFLCNDASDEVEKRTDLINQADSRICDFLRRVPPWKMDVSPPRGPDRKGQAVKQFGWNPHPVDIQAANSVCDLFRYPFPIKSLRPMMIPGLLRVAIVYLDACVFLGLDSPVFRERISALIRILTIHGETWPLSKKIAEDIQAVADEYLPCTDESSVHTSSSDPDDWNTLVHEAMSSSGGGAPNFFRSPGQLRRLLVSQFAVRVRAARPPRARACYVSHPPRLRGRGLGAACFGFVKDGRTVCRCGPGGLFLSLANNRTHFLPRYK